MCVLHVRPSCVSFQFMTVAADGLVLVWDLRFEEAALAAMRRKGGNPDEKKGDAAEVVWQPLYKLVATKPTGVGELPLNCVSLRPADGTGTARFSMLFMAILVAICLPTAGSKI